MNAFRIFLVASYSMLFIHLCALCRYRKLNFNLFIFYIYVLRILWERKKPLLCFICSRFPLIYCFPWNYTYHFCCCCCCCVIKNFFSFIFEIPFFAFHLNFINYNWAHKTTEVPSILLLSLNNNMFHNTYTKTNIIINE